MTIDAIEVPNADAPDVLAALEQRWKADAVRLVTGLGFVYDDLPARHKMRACLVAQLRVITKNYRREAAERALAVPEVVIE